MANLRSGKGLVAKREHGGSWKKLQLLNLREFRDDVFGHAIAKVFVLFVVAKIREVQHGNSFFRP